RVIRAGMTEEEKRTHARKLNMARRQLNQEQRRELIREQLKETPEKSDRQIAKSLGVDHTTVTNQRHGLESTGEIHQLDKTIGADGKARTTTPQRKPVSVFNPTPREEKAVKQPEIVNKMAENGINAAGAIRESKREKLIEHLESVENQQAKAIEGVYDVIVIDPPWDMQKIERNERPNQSGFDYPTMSIREIKGMDIPAADDCHVFLWTTQKFLPDAFDILNEWGMKYVCTFVWHKNNGYKPFGLPTYNCEFILYAHKGAPQFVDEKAFFTCFDAPQRGHSVKPEEFYEIIRRVTAGRRLDMFGRRKIDGFDSWGKEAPAFE
ncbi:MAG: hypothetical protein LIO86_09375, partial [Lachnospiraceae bacterium]|nr:hypothetical protein [Lachnospiraceae bacterium]